MRKVQKTCHDATYWELPEMSSIRFAAKCPSMDPFVVCTSTQPPEREAAEMHASSPVISINLKSTKLRSSNAWVNLGRYIPKPGWSLLFGDRNRWIEYSARSAEGPLA
jgi:hypothetical protein